MSSSINNRKIPLEELDKDELLKRCKHYLTLAQKAKTSKDEAQQREVILLEKVTSLEEKIVQLEKENAVFILEQETKNAQSRSQLENGTVYSDGHSKVKPEVNIVDGITDGELKLQLKELEERYQLQKDGFVEELNKMNDLLKKRGETISKLEEKCQLLDSELKSKAEAYILSLTEKDHKIETLEQELNRFEMQSEIASTSTVSRAEEIHRMKDVEDSLEERYNRLKALAVKMKRKIAEQNSVIADKEKQLSLLEQKKNSSGSTSLNLPALQKDIDRLNDELDMKKSQISVLKKDLEGAVQELANTKQISEELKVEVSSLKANITNLEKQKSSLELSSQELKTTVEFSSKELETEKILRLELSREGDKLRNENTDLKNTIEQLSRGQEAAKQDSKKQSLLELELSDYEKSVGELNIRLNALQLDNKRQENLLKEQSHEKNSLLNKVKNLEEQIECERKRSEENLAKLNSQQAECEELKKLTDDLKVEIKKGNTKNESKECELENARLQLATTNADFQKYRNSTSLKLDTLQKQISIMEQQLATEQKTKETLELHLAELRSEFESYKVRATSVLKKAKTEVQSSANNPKEASNDEYTEQVEREMLQRVVEALKMKVSELESQHSLAQGEIVSLRAEKERVAAAHAVALDATQQRLQHCEAVSEKQKQDYQNQIARIQSDHQLLLSLHRDQVDSLKVQHAQEILKLEARLEESIQEAEKLQKFILRNNPRSTSTTPSLKDLSLEETNIPDQERVNEGESDVFPSLSRENSLMDTRKPIPLDLLLSSSHIQDEVEIRTPEVGSASIEHYKESLAVYEKQCQHLASLLAESEANEARLSQLADALKEEIRRSQRAEERQKHIENLEYLKNVVLKFITLPRGEERSRLVPVLTTILRLSPSEVQEVSQTLNRNDGSTRPMAWGGVFNYFAPNQ